MKVAPPQTIKEREDQVIASGVSAESLMEEAGLGIARIIRREFGDKGHCVAYLGKGNNAGDALVVLRYLQEWGWSVGVRAAYGKEEATLLYQQQWDRIPNVLQYKDSSQIRNVKGRPLVLLDGLVGLGAMGGLKAPLDALAREINVLRKQRGAVCVAIDLPSGVDSETGEVSGDAVIADISAVIAVVKSGMVRDASTAYVGRMEPVALAGLDVEDIYNEELYEPGEELQIIAPRPYEWYKGNAGRVSIIAGSVGMTGAARLCAESALRAGAGMVTLFALPEVYSLLAVNMPPEVMVKPITRYTSVHEVHCDVLLMGPGLGAPKEDREEELLGLINRYQGKLVLDADILNLLTRRGLLHLLKENHLITPHIGEMERLFARLPEESRVGWARRFTLLSSATLLLKGARTLVAGKGRKVRYNSTGGPGMGTAGQGDVLSGVCAALCAQGMNVYDSASLGAWLCGKAAEIAMRGDESEQSLIASDTIKNLGKAFGEAIRGRR